MSIDQSFDIVIVGGGIVGGALAVGLSSALRDQNISIALIEKEPQKPAPKSERADPISFDPRVVALNNNSIQFLQDLDVWSHVEGQGLSPYTKMHVWDGEGTGSIDFDARDIYSPMLGAIVENSILTASLYDGLGLGNRSGIAVPDKYTAPDNVTWVHDHVTGCEHHRGSENLTPTMQAHRHLTLSSGLTLQAGLVLAADGAESPLREMNGFDVRQWDYQQTAIVTTVRTEDAHNATAWQRFTRFGPLAFLPLRAAENDTQQHCSIVWSLDRHKAHEVMALSDQDFCQQLGRAFEFRLGKIEHAAKRFAIDLQQMHAKDYIRPGFALLGDAAHRIHPLAGQGVNLGLSDAQVMIEEITRACQRSVPLQDPSILKRYQRRRRSENLAAMIAMEGFKRLFGSDELSVVSARNAGLRLFNRLPSVKRQLSAVAQGVSSSA